MKVQNALVRNTENRTPKEFSAYINGASIKKAIIDRLNGDVQAASRLISTITAAVDASDKLKECDYKSIVNAALTGEVGMNLSYALGQYAIIPYGKEAKYQLQVNGLKQLCIRSKAYDNINCFDVREGEFLGRDPRTRDPIFKWIEDEDLRLSLPIVGYYAFYILNEANNHFFRCLYWSHEKILLHADRYAPGFSLDKYRALLNGELPAEDVAKLQGTKQKKGSSPWYANPNDDPHIKMCMKTVLKQLLNDGLAPKAIQDAIVEDDETDANLSVEGDVVASEPVVETTGEVVDDRSDNAEPVDETERTAEDNPAEPEEPAKRRRGRPARNSLEHPEDDSVSGFFDMGDEA